MKKKILKAIKGKDFANKAEMKKFLKLEFDIRSEYTPEEFELEEHIEDMLKCGYIEKRIIIMPKGNKLLKSGG